MSVVGDPPLASCEFAGIDFESAASGRGEPDLPIQIGLGILAGTGKVDRLVRSYVLPSRPPVWTSSDIHGIRAEHLEGAPSLNELWPTITGCLRGRIVVAHGAATEKRFLRAFPMHGFAPWLDTLALSRKTLPSLSDYSLGSCAAALDVVEETGEICATIPGGEGLGWHDALYDTVACLLVLRDIIEALDLWGLPLSAFREMGVVKG